MRFLNSPSLTQKQDLGNQPNEAVCRMYLAQAERDLLVVLFKFYLVCFYIENGEQEPVAIPSQDKAKLKRGRSRQREEGGLLIFLLPPDIIPLWCTA